MNLIVKCGFPATVCGVVCKLFFFFFKQNEPKQQQIQKMANGADWLQSVKQKKKKKKKICQYVKAGLSQFINALKMLPL